MASIHDYDLIIIGAGPSAWLVVIEAKKSGLRYLIIEKGCLVNSLYNYPLNMTFFSTSERLEIGDVPFISHGAKPNRVEALEYFRRVSMTWSLNVKLYEKVESVEHSTAGQVIKTSKGVYSCSYTILALGFYDLPYLLNVPAKNCQK
jgi:thioredoxin reductase (NADPH)